MNIKLKWPVKFQILERIEESENSLLHKDQQFVHLQLTNKVEGTHEQQCKSNNRQSLRQERQKVVRNIPHLNIKLLSYRRNIGPVLTDLQFSREVKNLQFMRISKNFNNNNNFFFKSVQANIVQMWAISLQLLPVQVQGKSEKNFKQVLTQ